MKVLVATRSAGKQREVKTLLGAADIEVVFPMEAGLLETPEETPLELGPTFEANARAKAEHFAKRSGLPTLADDSGLELFSLGGEPGVRSRRWTGVEGPETYVDAANNAYLLRRLLGAPSEKRRARYRCVLAFVPRVGAVPQLFEGACTGVIATEPRGEAGFGYDPLFISDDLQKTFGEAQEEEKNRVSHRARAFQAFLQSFPESR